MKFPVLLTATLVAALLSACAQAPQAPPSGLMEVAERPAEKALLAGIRAYDDAQYPEAEKQLAQALKAGLTSARDRAAAHKYLAFIYCTSKRSSECEAAFRRRGHELEKTAAALAILDHFARARRKFAVQPVFELRRVR